MASLPVIEIIARVLRISVEQARRAERGISQEWDSLRHIEILMQVEEEFELYFDESDFAQIISADSIDAAIVRIRGN